MTDDYLERRPEAQMDTETHNISLILTEDQAEAMAGGYVPRAVKAILREVLDFALEDLRRAERPMPKTRKRRRTE